MFCVLFCLAWTTKAITVLQLSLSSQLWLLNVTEILESLKQKMGWANFRICSKFKKKYERRFDYMYTVTNCLRPYCLLGGNLTGGN